MAGEVRIKRGVSHRRLRGSRLSRRLLGFSSVQLLGSEHVPAWTCVPSTRVNKQIWADTDGPLRLPFGMKERWWYEWCIVLLQTTNTDTHRATPPPPHNSKRRKKNLRYDETSNTECERRRKWVTDGSTPNLFTPNSQKTRPEAKLRQLLPF